MPKVSVILTSYNHAPFLRQAIESVLDQTFSDFELIIWDDQSTDDSWEIIMSYHDPRIKAYQNEQRMMGGNLNRALTTAACGEYIAIHHSDDAWQPAKLAKQVAFLNDHPEYGAVFTNAQAIDEAGQPLAEASHFYAKIFDQPNRTRHEWLRFFFYHGNALCHPSVLIRKACYDTVGLYEYGYGQLGDFNMWVRLCMRYEIFVLPKKLVQFRVRASEANTSGNRPETLNQWTIEYLQSLRKYVSIDDMQALVAIFPEAQRYATAEGSDQRFALAMICLQEQTGHIHKLLGYELLFDLISHVESAERLKRLYDFDYRNLIALTGRYDVFHLLNASIARLLVDTGKGYHEHAKVVQEVYPDFPAFALTFDLSHFPGIRALRFEPLKGRWSQVMLTAVVYEDMQGSTKTIDPAMLESNGIRHASGAVSFETLEPMFFLPISGNIRSLSLRGTWKVEPIKNAEIHAKIQLIQRMENSLSWKITRPLRWLRNLTL